jgi:hypothetical protein
MEWTEEEFFANGGTTAFIDRLSASLGIHASTIKVVSVYEGSLSVDYEISATPEEPLNIDQLKEVQRSSFATGTVDLGAPVLDVAAGEEKVVEDGVVTAAGFDPVVITMTDTN